jgi:hypothetical protein
MAGKQKLPDGKACKRRSVSEQVVVFMVLDSRFVVLEG